MTTIPKHQQKNYEIFRDCLSTALIEKISQPRSKKPKRKHRSKKYSSSAPPPTSPISTSTQNGDTEKEADPSVEADDLADFADYIAAETFHSLPDELKTLDYYTYTKSPDLQTRTAPPAPRSTMREADGCEVCGRDWVPLSYHHLIPRFVHSKAVKRGWHRAEDLQNVAWLCGACHRFVHRFAGHEELARRYYTVELLMAEEQVRRWADWVGRLRWKGR
ncbi:hypothetical protein M434DRAFT_379625 [Hypoxylon sp. CO27-5]|nr:hypothetical protein M434DRAFT_379625 [Hypoxylon sp. CO27-5]